MATQIPAHIYAPTSDMLSHACDGGDDPAGPVGPKGSGGSVALELDDADADALVERTALIVDDDVVVCQALSVLLRAVGWRTVATTDSTAAAAMVRAHRPDVVLVDAMMQGMDGVDVVRALRALPDALGRTRIVAMSGLDAAGMVEAGADAYVAKPASVEALLRVMATPER